MSNNYIKRILVRNRHKSKTLSFHWIWSKKIHSWTVDWSWLSFDLVHFIKISLYLIKISLMITHVLSTLINGSYTVMEALVVVYWGGLSGFLLTVAVNIALGVVAVFPVSSVCICLWSTVGMFLAWASRTNTSLLGHGHTCREISEMSFLWYSAPHILVVEEK